MEFSQTKTDYERYFSRQRIKLKCVLLGNSRWVAMLNVLGVRIKNTLRNQLSQIGRQVREKIAISSWMDSELEVSFIRYCIVLILASSLNAFNILISVYWKGINENPLVESLYSQKEIGTLPYFFTHFPQNIFGFVILWGLLPLLVGFAWYGTLVILNGREKEIHKPTVALISLNSILIPLAGILIQEIFGILKRPFGAAGLLPMILTLFWGFLTIVTYSGSLVYSVLSIRKQFQEPLGRAVLEAISPAILAIIIFIFFY